MSCGICRRRHAEVVRAQADVTHAVRKALIRVERPDLIAEIGTRKANLARVKANQAQHAAECDAP